MKKFILIFFTTVLCYSCKEQCVTWKFPLVAVRNEITKSCSFGFITLGGTTSENEILRAWVKLPDGGIVRCELPISCVQIHEDDTSAPHLLVTSIIKGYMENGVKEYKSMQTETSARGRCFGTNNKLYVPKGTIYREMRIR